LFGSVAICLDSSSLLTGSLRVFYRFAHGIAALVLSLRLFYHCACSITAFVLSFHVAEVVQSSRMAGFVRDAAIRDQGSITWLLPRTSNL
jgi:hypothetical protein